MKILKKILIIPGSSRWGSSPSGVPRWDDTKRPREHNRKKLATITDGEGCWRADTVCRGNSGWADNRRNFEDPDFEVPASTCESGRGSQRETSGAADTPQSCITRLRGLSSRRGNFNNTFW